MKALTIDVETLAQTRAALSSGAEVLAAECQRLRREPLTPGVPGAVFERSQSAWEDLVDELGNWVTTLESTIARMSSAGDEAAETDAAIARALEKLA